MKVFNRYFVFFYLAYLNDFTSSCTQPVTQETCNNALDTTKYTGSFCLITVNQEINDVYMY